jgi:hypothetical protein
MVMSILVAGVDDDAAASSDAVPSTAVATTMISWFRCPVLVIVFSRM